MRIVVLGASGGCGQQLVSQAAEAGADVVAVGRASSTLKVPDGVDVERGSLDDEGFLAGAFQGADAVVSALGLRIGSLAPWARAEDPTLLSRTAPVWVAAMRAAGVSRIMAISAGGVADSFQQVPRLFRMVVRISALRRAYAELARMEAILAASGLDWCCPRPTGLTDGPVSGRVRVVEGFRGYAQISRADVAAWMLAQLEGPGFTQRTPMITVTG